MARYEYKDVIKVLLERFPEFAETENFREGVFHDIPYSVWGAFGHYITDHIRKVPVDRLDEDDLTNRVFSLANDLMESGDDETQTIVVIELFENFYSYRKTLKLARRKLHPRHRPWLEKQGQWLTASGEDMADDPGDA